MFIIRRLVSGRSNCLQPKVVGKLMRKSCLSTAANEPRQSMDTSTNEKARKDPFSKNLLLGKFDSSFLVYPEIDIDSEIQSAVVLASPNNKLMIKEETGVANLKNLLKKGVLKHSFDPNVKETEKLKAFEILDLDTETAVCLDMHSLVIQTLLDYGSESLKAKYLDKLISGELIGAYALAEQSGGSDPSTITTSAVTEESTFCINGEKVWVTNGSKADIFLVFANGLFDNFDQTKDTSILLVIERNFNGLNVTEHNTVGLKSCGISKLVLKDVTVPEENAVCLKGEALQLAAQKLNFNKRSLCCSLLGNMKKMLSNSVAFIKPRKQYASDLKDRELIKNHVSVVAQTIYSLESVLYLLAGMQDMYHIDVSYENSLIELFCCDRAVNAIRSCSELLGSVRYDESAKYNKLLRDIEGITLYNTPVEVHSLYVALLGVQYAGNNISNLVKKIRNPFDYPAFIFRRMMQNNALLNDKPKMKLKLYENLHPSLQKSAELLEYSVLKLQFVVEHALSTYGIEIVNKQIILKRLSEVIVDVLIMTSVLGRSSRAYCTGMKYGDHEITLAQIICLDSVRNVRKNIADIIDGGIVTGDISKSDMGKLIFDEGGYFVEHPLIRNIH